VDRPSLDHGARMNLEQQVSEFFVELIYQEIPRSIQPWRSVDGVMCVAGYKVHQPFIQ